MNKAKRFCMKRLSRNYFEAIVDKLFVFTKHGAFHYNVSPIRLIIEDRVAQVFHVRANLMRSASLQSTLDQGDISQIFDQFVIRNSSSSKVSFRKRGSHPAVF